MVGFKAKEKMEDIISPKQLLREIVKLIHADPLLMLSVSIYVTIYRPGVGKCFLGICQIYNFQTSGRPLDLFQFIL